MPKVTVIIPTYNAQEYIDIALQSVTHQTLTDWELIVSDDASRDATLEHVDRFKCIDDRITILQSSNNSGPGKARNRALSCAKGEWIAILDSDDWWENERLANLISYAEANGLDVVLDDLWLHKPDSAPRKWSEVSSTIEPYKGLLIEITDICKTPIAFLKVIVRKQYLDRSGVKWRDWRYSEDFGFLLEMAWSGAIIGMSPEALYHYRALRPGSLSQNSVELYYGIHQSANYYVKLLSSERTDSGETAMAIKFLKRRSQVAYRMYAARKLLNIVIPSATMRNQLLKTYHKFKEF